MHKARGMWFADWQTKASYLDGACDVDARLPKVRDVARRLTAPFNANDLEGQARCLFNWVRDRIRYVRDPNSEEFSDAQQVLKQSYGDCDDKVRVFVALARSVGLEAHVRPVLRADDFTHVQAVVRWPGSFRFPKAHAGGWVTCELILRDAQLGDEVQDVPNRVLA